MVREDLVNSAVSFLQDPSVANAPLDKRIAFLQSKNLTQDEVDAALARAGEGGSVATTSGSAPAGYGYGQPPPPPGYGPYPNAYWQQPPPPPEVPKRDWRDWFIMATVMGGVSYGLYFTAKRYILPLIKPPTPEQVEQDKSSIDTQFDRAFALIEQLTTDTASLKTAEEQRTARVDAAISEFDSALTAIKDNEKRRQDDARHFDNELRTLRDDLPKALDAQKDSTEAKIRDLGNELKSLKTLINNRLGGQPGSSAAGAASLRNPNVYGGSGINGATSGPASPAATSSGGPVGGISTTAGSGAPAGQGSNRNSAELTSGEPDRTQSASPYNRLGAGRAAIPAWQMAAAKKNQANANDGATNGDNLKKDTSESGTVTESTADA